MRMLDPFARYPGGAVRLGAKRLTTAEILYHMPDHPGLLQTFVWQTDDVAPDFPRLTRFLDHWRREIDAAIHSVSIANADLGRPTSWTFADVALTMH